MKNVVMHRLLLMQIAEQSPTTLRQLTDNRNWPLVSF